MLTRWTAFLVLILMVFVSCSTMSLTIKSDPEKATVYIREGKLLKKVGETPIRVTARELGGAAPFNLVIRKEGFQTEQLLVEERTLAADAQIYASLKRATEDSGRGVASLKHSSGDLQRSIASIQAKLIQNNYQEAELQAKGFVNTNPYSAVGWTLLGNAYVLQNKNQLALEAYQKANTFDPDNPDTVKMIEFLGNIPERRGR